MTRWTPGLRAVLAALAVVLAVVAAPTSVSAHASLLRAEPAPDAAVREAPPRVTVWFSEPIAPALSGIEVFDADRRKVDRDDVQTDASDATRISVGLEALGTGTYTVVWRNVSTVDGHALRGSYVFFVGERPADAVSGSAAEPPTLPSPADPWVRWLVLLTALGVSGSLLFEAGALRPALAGVARASTQQAGVDAATVLRRMRRAGYAVFLVASLLHVAVQASVVSGAAIWAIAPGDVYALLWQTTWGHYWLARVALVGAAAVASVVLARREQAASGVALGLWLAALGTFTGSSHAAAAAGLGVTAVAADYVHIIAAAVWVGGLFALLPTVFVLLRGLPAGERRPVLSALVARFSLLAALGLGTLAITGLFSAWVQVGGLDAIQTPYGWSYAGKMGFFIVLAGLGAVNLLWVRPRLARAERADGAAVWLRRLVAGEVALALLVILATGFMTSMEPARQAAARANGGGVVFDQTDGGTRILARVEPGLPGNNRVRVELFDRRGERVTNASTVTTHVKYLDVDLGERVVTATLDADGVYVAPNIPLSIGGAWQVQVRVTRPDAADATAATRFAIGATASTPAGSGASPEMARALWSWAVVALGLLCLVLLPRLWRSRIARGRARIVSTAVLLSGVVLVYGVHAHGGPVAQANANPVTPDAASIQAGRMLYQQQCVNCHGATGQGDGPLAKDLNPPPLNLVAHVPLHGDGQIFQFISGGVPGTAMPVWAGTLSDTQMWHLVNYLRTLAEPAAVQ